MKIFLLFIALAAGMMAPVQAGLNAKLGRAVGNPVYASLISFITGTLGLFFYCIVSRLEFGSIRLASGLPWPVWAAGLLGAFYVTATIVLTPKLGAALTFGLVVAGQLIMAVGLDHLGLLGIPVQALTWQRLAGIALITAGVFLIKKF